MKRMLINATQAEEIRVAIVEGQNLYDLDVEVPDKGHTKSNIYKGRITRVEASLEACFVDYGAEKNGFLPLKEIAKEYFQPGTSPNKNSTRELLKEGQEIIVQIDKEERGNKGAALTSFVSLAGRYLVLMPNSPRAGGVSRRIEGDERANLKEQLDQLNVPDNMGMIIRTAGMGRELEELQWDLDYLVKLWRAISDAAKAKSGQFLLYQESKLLIRALRDYLRNDITEVLIDDAAMYEEAREFTAQVMPGNLRKLKHYTDSTPLFTRFQIETQIESAHSRTVRLPSGGSIVVDKTEALTAIDINSARATKGGDIEETALNTNLEAAEEIGRQLRVRDVGGLVVIDFIDMESSSHQRQVEDRLKDALKLDRARIQLGKISRFGLMEMSRQRMRPALSEAHEMSCPRCQGHGHIRGVESLALSILRLAEEQVMRAQTAQVLVHVPADVANFLLNEKRNALINLETRHGVPLIVLSNPNMDTPDYQIERIKSSEATDEPSYKKVKQQQLISSDAWVAATAAPQTPAVDKVLPATIVPAPKAPSPEIALPAQAEGLVARMMNWFRRAKTPEPTAESANEAPKRKFDSKPQSGLAHQRPKPAQAGGQGKREDRGDRKNENGDRKNENSDRKDRGDSKDRNQAQQQQGRGEKQGQQNRGQRGEQNARPDASRTESGRAEQKPANQRNDNGRAEQQQQKRDERSGNAPSSVTGAVAGAAAGAAGAAVDEQKQALPQAGEKLSNRQERQKQFEARRDQQRADARERHERRAAAAALAAETGAADNSDAQARTAALDTSGRASAVALATNVSPVSEAPEAQASAQPKQQTLFPNDEAKSPRDSESERAQLATTASASDVNAVDDANDDAESTESTFEIGPDGLPLERKRKRRRRGGRGRRRGREDGLTDVAGADDDSEDDGADETTSDVVSNGSAAANDESNTLQDKSRNPGLAKPEAIGKNESAWDRQVRDEQARDQGEDDTAKNVSAQAPVEVVQTSDTAEKVEPQARRERRPRARPQPAMQPLPQPQSLALAVAVAVDQLSTMPSSLAATSGQKRAVTPTVPAPEPAPKTVVAPVAAEHVAEPAANDATVPVVRRPWMAEFPVNTKANSAPLSADVEKPKQPVFAPAALSTQSAENAPGQQVPDASTATGAEP